MIDNLVLSRAKAAVLARDFSTAARLFKNLLNENPNDVSLLTQVGNMYVKSGNDDKALPVFKQVLELDSENLGAMNNLGAIYRRRKEYKESEEILLKACKLKGGNTQAEYNLGFTYKIMGEYDKAIDCFEDVIAANPSDVLAYNHIGAIYAERGEHENAVQSYLRALKIDPNHPVLHLNIAKSYEKLQKTNEALLEYENALRTKPGWLEAIDGYADLLMANRRTKDASAIVMQAIRIAPENEKMHTKLGNVFERQGDANSAVDEYSQALNIKDDYVPALSGLASSYEKTGNFPAALQTMKKLESIKPGDAEVLRQYSGILLSAKEIDAAKKKIDTLLEIAADDPHTLNLLGQYDICIGDFDSAKECFDKIESLNPSYKEYLKDGAKRMKQQGIFDKSESMQKEYLAEHPEDPEALNFLAELYEEQNKISEALEMYKRSLNADSGYVASKNGMKRIEKRLSEDAPIFDSIEDIESVDSEDNSNSEDTSEESSAEIDAEFESEENEENGENSESEIPFDDEENFDISEIAKDIENDENEDSEIAEDAMITDEADDAEQGEIEADAVEDDVPDLSSLKEESDDDIFSSLSGSEDSDSEIFNSPESSDVEIEENNIESKMAEPYADIDKKIEQGIDEIVPLDDITDFDFSEIQKHNPNNKENFSWPLSSDTIKDFVPPKVIPEMSPNTLKEALKNAIPAVQKTIVVHVKDDAPKTDFAKIQADFDKEDLRNAVDFTGDFKKQTKSFEEKHKEKKDEKPKVSETYTSEKIVGLFEQIKSLFGALPDNKRQEFLKSRQRMLLEFVLSKLHKNTGLLCRATKKRTELGLPMDSKTSAPLGKSDVKNVMNLIVSLTKSMPDESLATAMAQETSKVLEKL